MTTTENYISVSGVNLYFEFINKNLLSESRPLLVFLHEGLGSTQQWKDFPALLCEKVNCPALLFDREGHGKSQMLKLPRSNDFMQIQAQVVLPELFKKLNLEHFDKILIGHSDGGSIAIIHAASYTENIIGVITEAAHMFIEEITVAGLKDTLRSFETGRLRELLYKYHGENTDTMFHGWSDTWLREEFTNWNIEAYLEKIKVPYLAIQGQNDQYGTTAQLDVVRKFTINSQISLIPDCGHIPHFQAKETVMDLMENFILKL